MTKINNSKKQNKAPRSRIDIGPSLISKTPKQEKSRIYDEIRRAGYEETLLAITRRHKFNGGSSVGLCRLLGDDEELGRFFKTQPKHETLQQWVKLYPEFRDAFGMNRQNILLRGASKLHNLIEQAEDVGDIPNVIAGLQFLDDGTLNHRNREEETIKYKVAQKLRDGGLDGVSESSKLPDVTINFGNKGE